MVVSRKNPLGRAGWLLRGVSQGFGTPQDAPHGRRKKTRTGRASVAQIAPFSVPGEYLRSYVNQVKVVGGWLDLCRPQMRHGVAFVCQNRSPTFPGLGTGMASGCALRFLFTL